MSFLQQLQNKRSGLKPTTTTVTTATGKRFIEANSFTSTPVPLEEQTYGFIVDTKPDTVPACILPELLYLGSQDAVNNENVGTFKITHILSVGIETPFLANGEVQIKHVPCLDLPETKLLENVIPETNAFINEAKLSQGRVLVHCNAGVSRAASAVIGYLMLERGMPFDDAYSLVKLKRECIQPNVGFIKQLKNLKIAD
ncbi:dual specificity protein phosphatase 19 [Rhagoletis pomonella]|uniref:dual specificity protein phosphatase 19 n=1 Tax=Rhagoletis pomonella TaxID=28610 RepID=UPI00177BE453|nr:dual specificity protein phosphatase 19 [Rhagoletis pomonella]